MTTRLRACALMNTSAIITERLAIHSRMIGDSNRVFIRKPFILIHTLMHDLAIRFGYFTHRYRLFKAAIVQYPRLQFPLGRELRRDGKCLGARHRRCVRQTSTGRYLAVRMECSQRRAVALIVCCRYPSAVFAAVGAPSIVGDNARKQARPGPLPTQKHAHAHARPHRRTHARTHAHVGSGFTMERRATGIGRSGMQRCSRSYKACMR